MALWRAFFERTGRELFHPSGVLWISNGQDSYTPELWNTLGKVGIPREQLSSADLRSRYPQLRFDDEWGVLEPESGVLMARQAVQTVVKTAVEMGIEYSTSFVLP